MLFNSMKDYSDRYGGTLVGKRTEHGIIPIVVNEVSGNVRSPMFRGNSVLPSGNLEIDGKMWSFKDPDMMLHPPKLGLCGSEGRLSFVKRKPERRWKQGLELGSCLIRGLVPNGHAELNRYDLFNPVDRTFEEAFKLALNSQTGHRVSRTLGIVGTGSKTEAALVYRDATIGKVINEGKKIVIPKNFEPMRDTFKRAGILYFDMTDAVNNAVERHLLKYNGGNEYIQSSVLAANLVGDVSEHTAKTLRGMYNLRSQYLSLATISYPVKILIHLRDTPEYVVKIRDSIYHICKMGMRYFSEETPKYNVTAATEIQFNLQDCTMSIIAARTERMHISQFVQFLLFYAFVSRSKNDLSLIRDFAGKLGAYLEDEEEEEVSNQLYGAYEVITNKIMDLEQEAVRPQFFIPPHQMQRVQW